MQLLRQVLRPIHGSGSSSDRFHRSPSFTHASVSRQLTVVLVKTAAGSILFAMAHTRYHVSKNPSDQYWSIVDEFTGWPADFFGAVLDTLEAEEVERLVHVLNDRDRIRRSRLGIPC